MVLRGWIAAGLLVAAGAAGVAWRGASHGDGVATPRHEPQPLAGAASVASGLPAGQGLAATGSAGFSAAPDAASAAAGQGGLAGGAGLPETSGSAADAGEALLPAALAGLDPARRARLARLLGAGAEAAADPSGRVPPPVQQRRSARHPSVDPSAAAAAPVQAAEIGLPLFPGAVALSDLEGRSASPSIQVTTAVLRVGASQQTVQDYYRRALPISVQGDLIVQDLAPPGGALDLRRIDLAAGTLQRVQVDALQGEVYIRLSSTRLR